MISFGVLFFPLAGKARELSNQPFGLFLGLETLHSTYYRDGIFPFINLNILFFRLLSRLYKGWRWEETLPLKSKNQ